MNAQGHVLDENGHLRKACEGEDPHRTGLVLQWVYGAFVSPAEKAQNAAKRSLGKADIYCPRGTALCSFRCWSKVSSRILLALTLG